MGGGHLIISFLGDLMWNDPKANYSINVFCFFFFKFSLLVYSKRKHEQKTSRKSSRDKYVSISSITLYRTFSTWVSFDNDASRLTNVLVQKDTF